MMEYIGIDGNPISKQKPIAYCRYYKGYLTKRMIKTHRCLTRQCSRLERLDSDYWTDREQRKISSKSAKKALLEKQI